MADKTVIVEIKYDTDEAVKSLENLTAVVEGEKVEQAKLRQELETGQKSQKEYSIAVEQSKQTQQKANTERKNTLNLLGAEKGSVNELKAAINKLQGEQNNINLTTKEGSKQYKDNAVQIGDLKKALKDAQSETGKTSGMFGDFSKKLDSIPGPIGGIIQGFTGMAKAALAFVANPIGAVIAALAAAVMLVVSAFKTFEPIIEWIEQKIAAVSAVFTVFKETVVSLFTGQKKLNEAFDGMGASMKKAADEAIRLKKAEQELEEMSIRLIASQATYKRQIDQLLLQSKNRTLSEKERMALIDEALEVEKKAYKERQDMADGEYEQALGAITNGRNFTDQEIQNIKDKGIAYLQQFQNTKAITDEEVTTFANAIAAREDILRESIVLQEKAMNRRDVLQDKADEKEAASAQKYAEQMASKAAIDEVQALAKGEKFAVDEQMAADELAWTEAQAAKEQEVSETAIELSAEETAQLNKDLEEGYNNFVKWKEAELAKQQEIDTLKKNLGEESIKAGQQIVTDQFNAGINDRLNSFKAGQEAEMQMAKDDLDKGVISKAQYEKKVKAINLKTRIEEAKADRKKALFSIGIDTLIGVSKAIAESPVTFGLPWSAFALATGAINAAVVLAKPLPTYAKGGVIGGKSHAQGGTKFFGSDGSQFEAERGEAMFVLKKDATAEIAALSAINERYGGRSFVGGGASHLAEGGEVSAANIENQVNRAMRNTPIVVRVADISTGLTDVSNVKSVGVI
jgi:hypothetical protein